MNWGYVLFLVIVGIVSIFVIVGIVKALLVYFFGVSDIVSSLVNIENLLEDNNKLLKELIPTRKSEEDEDDLYENDLDDL